MKGAAWILAGSLLAAAAAPPGERPAGGEKGEPPKEGDGKREPGLAAHYYRDPIEWGGNWKTGGLPMADALDWTFGEYRYTRVEPLVNHLFVRRGWFSVRWVGSIDLAPPGSGRAAPKDPAEVKFELWADDGARLFVDGRKVVDDWRPCAESDPASHRTATAALGPGPHRIVIEYFQGESLPQRDQDPAKLFWSSEALKIPRQIVPAAHFSHTDADLRDAEPSARGRRARSGGADAPPTGAPSSRPAS